MEKGTRLTPKCTQSVVLVAWTPAKKKTCMIYLSSVWKLLFRRLYQAIQGTSVGP